MERELTSRDNPAVKQYVKLASSRKERQELGLFVTEGIKLTAEAVAAGYPAVQIMATEQALDRYGDELQDATLESEAFFRISQQVADKLAQAVSPQGVFGVFRLPSEAARPVEVSAQGRYLLLCALQDPGNLGTILRTAAALGVDGVFLSADCPDLYSPKVLRAAMGGVFKLAVETCASLEQQATLLQQAGVRVYTAAMGDNARPLTSGVLGAGCAVVIGNEGAGLPEALIAMCDDTLTLPMRPDSESLNAAMAAGIFLWEMTR